MEKISKEIDVIKFNINQYYHMLDHFGLEKTWDNILNFLTGKTINDLSINYLLSFDNLGQLYEIGLAYSNKILKKDMGKYYTPQDVSDIMAKLLLENKIIKLADVGCGTGNLIISVLKHMKTLKGINPVEFILDGKLYLYEADPIALKICLKKIDILLKQEVSKLVNTYNGDFLDEDITLPMGVSVITNPPYAPIKNIKNNWSNDSVISQSKDLYAAFISKIINYCDSAVIVCPQSYLVAAKFSELRLKLSKNFRGEIFSFDNVPGTLFNGKKHGIFNTNTANGVRAAITSIQKSEQPGFNLTHLIRFKTSQRSDVITLDFLRSKLGTTVQDLSYPLKVFKELEPMVEKIKVNNNNNYLADLIENNPSKQKNEFKLYVSTSARYFTVASKQKLNRSGYFPIYAKNKEAFELLYSLINSSYVFMWWRFLDGGILFSKSILLKIPYDLNLIEKNKKIENFIENMIANENNYLAFKVNAGVKQESLKFPIDFRKHINKVLFPKYANYMDLVHNNFEVWLEK